MSIAYDRARVLDGLAQTQAAVPEAFALGRKLAAGVDRIYLVAAGSANRAMLGIAYWLEHYSPGIEVRRYFPAEFMAIDPPRLDGRTVVLLASKSGTTPETVAAAHFLKDKPCQVVAFSQYADKPLAQAVPQHFIVGDTSESFIAMFMLMQALVGGIMTEKEGWPLGDKLLASLDALPRAIADAAEQNEERAAADAALYAKDRNFYHVASGPGFTTAYVFGVCILMEMLWLHSYPIEAAEFFHGPFEIVDRSTPLILITGEDPSRPLMERVSSFCDTYAERVMKYDSRDFAMKGIAPEIRPIVAPYILQSALKRLSVHLSVLHNQPLTTRRYMWKVAY
ncbi:fructoselysine 6-phosphate deglycase [Bosea sp. BE125]|uniref:SIS domain-containing protein n=1 Tax=Bosea sp. BE125 TaxID=2817909 RepID=UPI002857F2F0|nr:phosphosugar isomerase [Bosea sp. BE125]MDR6874076.1 fructoselysine 6-phosphate deglycase [Bosea sp. BE125]